MKTNRFLVKALCVVFLGTLTLSACKIEEYRESQVNDPDYDFRINAIAQINQIRSRGTNCGGQLMSPVSRLAISTAIDNAAQKHADEMRLKRFVGRIEPSRGVRLANENVDFCNNNDMIAFRKGTSANALIEYWRSNPTECKKMMDGSFDHIGFGKSEDYFTVYFVEKECYY